MFRIYIRYHVLGLLMSLASVYAQTEVSYQFQHNKADSLSFYAQIPSGNTMFNATQNPNPLKIYGKLQSENAVPTFESKLGQAHFIVTEKNSSPLKKLTDSTLPSIWNIYANQNTAYRLNFQLGTGEIFFNLSDIRVKSIVIKSGNNKIKINYLAGKPNVSEMDSLVLKMEFGEAEIIRLNYARAKEVNAEVGVGRLLLDFSKDGITSSVVNVKTGAGSLLVRLHETDEVIMMRIRKTSLSKVELPKGFTDAGNGIYYNKPLETHKNPLLVFNIDVTMGKVIFEYK